jgi:probable lipoprotein NlpC
MLGKKLIFILFLMVIVPLCTTAQNTKTKKKAPIADTTNSKVVQYNLKLMCNKLQIPYDSSYNLDLLFESLEWIGSPYRYGQCSKDGTDCSGFTKSIYKDVFGADLARSSGAIFTQCNPVKKDKLQHGDMVFFKIGRHGISHVGVYLGYDYFIHASTQSGVIISSLEEHYYKRHYYSGGRPKETTTPK